MTPREAVIILAEIVRSRNDFTEDDVYEALSHAGVPDELADRTYKFTQVAWGRFFLDGLGVSFPQEYYWLSAAGKVVSCGELRDEPSFSAASSLAQQYAPHAGFQRLALMSADVQAVNEALRKGSKPANLRTAPVVMFTEAPTPEGLASANRLLAELLATKTPSSSKEERRPWWKLW